jgi:D-alanyl-D-alanine carboxypeptidase/D-alanyl-D-alanine-endopeptidase (penicillin-binding protein 4)
MGRVKRALPVAVVAGALIAAPVQAAPPWPGPQVGPAAGTPKANHRIARLVPRRIDHGALGRNVAVSVVDTATGRTLVARHARRGLAAASNTKLITALLAVQGLGPGTRVPTVVRRLGPRRIALVGGGDTLLSRGNVSALAGRTARALRRDGVRRVRVRIDASLYRWRGPGKGWASYEVGGNIGKVQPLNMNDARTGDGPGYVGRHFTSQLRARGLRATLGGRGPTRDAAPVLARYRGHRIKQIVRAGLLPSDSDDAEALGRIVATRLGFPGTYNGWWRAARRILDDLGVDRRGVRLYDASGLSQRNRVTTRFMTQLLLASMQRENRRMHVILRERRLPTAGYSGTLTTSLGRFVGVSSCARGRVFAKTGTIAGVVALSGYAMGADNRWKVFSILVNDRPGVDVLRSRQALDRIASTVTGCW